MEKLRLSVEDLAVTSFETDDAERDRGTVQAHMISGSYNTCKTCPTNNTCCTPIV